MSHPEGQKVSAQVARVTAALRADVEALTDGMVDQLMAQIRAFSRVPRAEVRASCLASNRLFLEVAASGRTVESAELPPFMPTPGWITSGISLEDALRAFRLGHMYMWDAIIAEATRGVTATEAALELARRSMDYIDVVSSAVAHAYLLAQQSVVADRDRSRSDLLQAILDGELPLSGTLRAQALADGLEPAGSYVVIVASIKRDASYAEQRQVARAVHDRMVEVCSGLLLVERSGELVGLLAPRSTQLQSLLDALDSSVRRLGESRGIAVAIGMSTSLVGLDAARLGYSEARRALSWAQPGPAIVALPLLSGFDYLIASADDTARRISSSADPLFGDHAADYGRETLYAYFDANLGVKQAAEYLGIHANTMHYRLRRIAEATGCDLHDFASLVELRVALRLREPSLGAHRDPQAGL